MLSIDLQQLPPPLHQIEPEWIQPSWLDATIDEIESPRGADCNNEILKQELCWENFRLQPDISIKPIVAL